MKLLLKYEYEIWIPTKSKVVEVYSLWQNKSHHALPISDQTVSNTDVWNKNDIAFITQSTYLSITDS